KQRIILQQMCHVDQSINSHTEKITRYLFTYHSVFILTFKVDTYSVYSIIKDDSCISYCLARFLFFSFVLVALWQFILEQIFRKNPSRFSVESFRQFALV